MPALPEADREPPPGGRPAADDLLVPGLPARPTVSEIDVACTASGDGWRCRVTVTDDRGASTFDVSVPPVGPFLLSVLPNPEFRDIDGLVHETFAFLLEREPRSSILARFDLPVVERYFPGYPAEMRRRLGV